jgi:hypothetical protein
MLATKKAAQLPEAEDCGHEQEHENRDRGERYDRDDHSFHGFSVPIRLRD